MKRIKKRCKWGTGKKIRYTYNEACAALDSAKRVKRGYRKECRIYFCRHCGGYHLTSQEKRRVE